MSRLFGKRFQRVALFYGATETAGFWWALVEAEKPPPFLKGLKDPAEIAQKIHEVFAAAAVVNPTAEAVG
eukprot:850771-Amphidinium_carterae.1